MPRVPRNNEGMTLVEWLRAAGWGDWNIATLIARDEGATFEQLAAAWTNGADPAEWRATAPKRFMPSGESYEAWEARKRNV